MCTCSVSSTPLLGSPVARALVFELDCMCLLLLSHDQLRWYGSQTGVSRSLYSHLATTATATVLCSTDVLYQHVSSFVSLSLSLVSLSLSLWYPDLLPCSLSVALNPSFLFEFLQSCETRTESLGSRLLLPYDSVFTYTVLISR